MTTKRDPRGPGPEPLYDVTVFLLESQSNNYEDMQNNYKKTHPYYPPNVHSKVKTTPEQESTSALEHQNKLFFTIMKQ